MIKIKYTKKIKNDNKFNKVVVSDFREYNAERCNDGGGYAYYIHFDKISDEKFTTSYYTSADFDYCPYCGSFISNYDHHVYNCDEEIVTRDELINIIDSYANKEKVCIDFYIH